MFLSLAACSSGGGGGDDDESTYTPAPPVSVYSGFDEISGSFVKLTITGDGAKALVLSGSYTLEIDGELVSAGRVSTSGGVMSFTSAGGKTFTAASDGAAPPVLPASIPKDDGTTATVNVTLSVSGGESDNPAVLVDNVQVYNPDGSLFTGNVNQISAKIYDGDGKVDYNIPIAMAGKIESGKLFLCLSPLSDADKPSSGDSIGTPKFFNGADYIDLSLLRTDIKTEGFDWYYLWESESDEDGRLYERGWMVSRTTYPMRDDDTHGNLLDVHPLQWFYNNGYKWIYNPDPLQGTWKHPASDGRTHVFSGNTYTTSKNENTQTDTFTLSGDVVTTLGGSFRYITRGNLLMFSWISGPESGGQNKSALRQSY
jgi:hypothetical protein